MNMDLFITLGVYIALTVFVLVLAWRFVRAHEEIAKSLRKLADTQSNKENKQP